MRCVICDNENIVMNIIEIEPELALEYNAKPTYFGVEVGQEYHPPTIDALTAQTIALQNALNQARLQIEAQQHIFSEIDGSVVSMYERLLDVSNTNIHQDAAIIDIYENVRKDNKNGS